MKNVLARLKGHHTRKRKPKDKVEHNPANPLRVLIGSTNGTRQDAEAMARTQIERYFDVPDLAWLYIVEEPGYGYHFEIHQSGDGRPFLPSVLDLELEAEDTVIIRPEGKTVVQVVVRPDGSYQSLILPERQSGGLETDPRLHPDKHVKMTPYVTTGKEWVKASSVVTAVGFAVLLAGGILNKAVQLSMDGYHEIAETLPLARLLELQEQSIQAFSFTPVSELPIAQWEKLEKQPLSAGQRVDRLEYEGGRWSVIVGSTPINPKPSPAAAPGGPAPISAPAIEQPPLQEAEQASPEQPVIAHERSGKKDK